MPSRPVATSSERESPIASRSELVMRWSFFPRRKSNSTSSSTTSTKKTILASSGLRCPSSVRVGFSLQITSYGVGGLRRRILLRPLLKLFWNSTDFLLQKRFSVSDTAHHAVETGHSFSACMNIGLGREEVFARFLVGEL